MICHRRCAHWEEFSRGTLVYCVWMRLTLAVARDSRIPSMAKDMKMRIGLSFWCFVEVLEVSDLISEEMLRGETRQYMSHC